MTASLTSGRLADIKVYEQITAKQHSGRLGRWHPISRVPGYLFISAQLEPAKEADLGDLLRNIAAVLAQDRVKPIVQQPLCQCIRAQQRSNDIYKAHYF